MSKNVWQRALDKRMSGRDSRSARLIAGAELGSISSSLAGAEGDQPVTATTSHRPSLDEYDEGLEGVLTMRLRDCNEE